MVKVKYALEAEKIIEDYKACVEYRQFALMGRREVLNGKAKFGVFCDGLELGQLALSRQMKKGDYLCGYYRDQFAPILLGTIDYHNLIAQLYGFTDVNYDTSSAGRAMVGHIATRFIDEKGEWLDQTNQYNICTDISAIAGMLPRGIGFALASKIYTNVIETRRNNLFSKKGNEVTFITIGDAGTSEGIFWETLNTVAVMDLPVVFIIWDNGYGISVPKEYHTPKNDVSDVLEGFRRKSNSKGIELFKVNGYNYIDLLNVFATATSLTRNQKIPTLIHVKECTQPMGHSTSGSHEKYKPKNRLDYEKNYDCLNVFKKWIISNNISTEEKLNEIDEKASIFIKKVYKKILIISNEKFDIARQSLQYLSYSIIEENPDNAELIYINSQIEQLNKGWISNLLTLAKKLHFNLNLLDTPRKNELKEWILEQENYLIDCYDTKLFPLENEIDKISPLYLEKPNIVSGREIINKNFEKILTFYDKVFIFGQDCGKMGDVNHGLEGLQEKFGVERVFDTGIREVTIIGQAIGMAQRGLKPIAEIQYLDYLVYALQVITDDIASMNYRTYGGQYSPLIIRTRGHRLEGIWHSGSPIAMILNSIRGIVLFVPRNYTQAAGMYNYLMQSNLPALIIEPLNSYNLKENMPINLGEYNVHPAEAEIIYNGKDITVITYGSCCNIALSAAKELEKLNISIEIIDVQCLHPFDKNKITLKSIQKTKKVIFLDEDMPGGTTAYMMKYVLEDFEGFNYLEIPPKTLAAKEHRPAYGTNGDYISKPNEDDLINVSIEIMAKADKLK